MNEDIQWFIGVLVVLALLWWGGRSALQNATPNSLSSTAPSSQTATQSSGQSPAAETKRQNTLTIEGLNRSSDPDSEYIVIRAPQENTTLITLTGLSLRSAGNGNEVRIPSAWKLPFPGASGDGEEVRLAPGEVAYIISGHSPNGMSFEANLCTGYLTSGLNFTPSLSRDCPSVARGPLPQPPNHLSDACLDFLDEIPSCTTPEIPLSLSGDGSCQAYIVKNTNYNACVSLHKNEAGFYRGAWYLYLNRGSSFWKSRRESAELHDQNGRLIDAVSFD